MGSVVGRVSLPAWEAVVVAIGEEGRDKETVQLRLAIGN